MPFLATLVAIKFFGPTGHPVGWSQMDNQNYLY